MRRLNVKLALWLVGIMLFSVVGVHFLHGYQLDRNADVLKRLAEKAQKDGNTREAINQYNQYLRHRDDREGYKALAELVVEVAKSSDATNKDKFKAYSILEEAIRRHPDLYEVRKSLVDYTMLLGRFPDALDHIAILQTDSDDGKYKADPDPALHLKTAICYFRKGDEEKGRVKLCDMIGFDEATGTFKETPPATAKEVNAFGVLAEIYRNKSDDKSKADANAIMTQLVAWNPDSAEAHLMRARYFLGLARSKTNPTAFEVESPAFQEAKAELAKAVALDDHNADTMLTVAITAVGEKDYAKAQEVLDRAVKEHPKRPEVYQQLAQLAGGQGDLKKAAEVLQLGIKQASDTRDIVQQLIEIQFQLNDLAGARETRDAMEKMEAFPPELIRYHAARLKLAAGDFQAATTELEQIRPAMARYPNPEFSKRVDLFLSKCYEVLGFPDRQLEVCRRLLQSYPDQLMARLGEAGALHKLGRFEEAETSVDLVALTAGAYPQVAPSILQLVVNQETRKPKAEQDWELIDKIADLLYKDPARPAMDNKILKADLLMARGEDRDAQEILTAARKEDPKNVAVWMDLAKLLNRDEKTLARLPQFLALAEKQLGDILPIRVEKMKVILRAGGDKRAEELKKLEAGFDKFEPNEQLSFMMQLGSAYIAAGNLAEATRCWKLVAEKDPRNVQIRQTLFELALEQKDAAGVEAVLKELRESPHFGSQNSLYKALQATELLYQLGIRRQGKTDPLNEEDRKNIADARKLIEEGLASRPDWFVLWRLRGELQQLEGNIDAATASFQRSLDNCRVGQANTAKRLVQLLYAQRKYGEANQALKYLTAGEIGEDMRRLVEDTKFKSGDAKAALVMAEKDIELHPDNPSHYVYYGQLLEVEGRPDDAEIAFRKATEVGPNLGETWDFLVRRLMFDKKKNEAVEAVRKAAEHISKNTLALAGLYQRVEDFERAEELYKVALEEKKDDLQTLRRIVEFYLTTNQADKATPYLDQIITAGKKSKDKGASLLVSWAHIRKAELLARVKNYQNVMAAIQEIEKNAVDGKLTQQDQLAIIFLLSERPEPESRQRATKMLEEYRKALQANGQSLNARQFATLGQLYNSQGRWTEGREMMRDAVRTSADAPDEPEVLIIFSKMLLDHDEVDEATNTLNRVEELLGKANPPASIGVQQAARMERARLLVKAGDKQKAEQLVEQLLTRPLPQAQLFRLEAVARQMEALGLNEGAQRLLEEYTSQEPRGTIALGAFFGRHGEADKAFALLDQSRQNQPIAEIMPVALEALRHQPEKATKERIAELEQWIASAMETEADKQRLLLLQGELLDMQGRYDEVEKIYRGILANDKSTDAQAAIAKNNLAFLLAIHNPTPQRATEASKMLDEAIKLFGPTSDLLDTRALILLALDKNEEAAADIRLAAADAPSASKYFHLAQVEKKLGNVDAAKEAMGKAKELVTTASPFTPAEKKSYDQLAKELL